MASEPRHQLVTRAFITPECMNNRGSGGAWEEAVRRLQDEYEAVVRGWKDAEEKPTFALMLFYERPIPDETAPVVPPLPTEGAAHAQEQVGEKADDREYMDGGEPGGTCPCGKPDPGIKPEGGCWCTDSERVGGSDG